MARKNSEKKRKTADDEKEEIHRLRPETKQSIWALVFLGCAALLFLAGFEKAGPFGTTIYRLLHTLFGMGYFVFPISFVVVSGVLLLSERQRVLGITLIGATLLIFSFLGLIDLVTPSRGGWLGLVLGSLRYPLGETAAFVVLAVVFLIAILVMLNAPLKLRIPRGMLGAKPDPAVPLVEETEAAPEEEKGREDAAEQAEAEKKSEDIVQKSGSALFQKLAGKKISPRKFASYVPPPLELLASEIDKPTTGDLRANANIVKRTLEGFGITVEMGEINIGPKVTRYTLKPAEGVKLSRITALHQDLALALAAHPIRIEAPIPGKSLVGIEVPNKAAALVRLGGLMHYRDFQMSGPLGFVLGRDVSGEPIYADIERMPHLLIAGATGSGKSVAIHSLLISLLYKNAPETLKLVLIDPKRVELTSYEGIPHLVSPVITESKKAIAAFRWALGEMDRRYELLEQAGSRDIKSYNANVSADSGPLPYLLIIVDELADLMTSYGREVEGSIVRLSQMARATGLHLVLSTQRPSVEIITGLIKANITSRIALQVASQVDSRTILDTSGAEKLLGGGDLLFISGELSKPKRIQGAYIPENEVHRVVEFIRDHNASSPAEDASVDFENVATGSRGIVAGNPDLFDQYLEDGGDELLDEAVEVVRQAKKASASLLQRRLKVGYARAARLLDIMEERGVIGPGDGAKPRDVYLGQTAE